MVRKRKTRSPAARSGKSQSDGAQLQSPKPRRRRPRGSHIKTPKRKETRRHPSASRTAPSHSDHPFAHLRPIIASSSSSQIPTVCQPLTPGHAAGATPQSQPLLKSCDSFATTRKCELLQRPAPNHSLKRKFRVRALKQRDGWRWAERSGVETRLPT